jgi:hypothetical protein
LFVYQNFAPFFFKGSSVITNISVANPAGISTAKHNFATATDIFRLRPNFSLNLAKNICLELATLIDVNNHKYSPVLGLSYAPFSFRGSLRPYTKIEKFDTKTNF